ncbi:hypothetical protein SAMD00019534_119280 [Acytostelium subglobosum LB1]|uniref:hypothetical protein n=1 Tax=Acytostelium subglobosum LB1 TaxID=1410327 RepID=UPI000644B5FD|nr:hypothetical protein SAMD00019534_119280 [Acytostelium subglobosum LB1]GAM28752.1 hypothetical protein SAMD00019534_119280 [Acytostelium subglobosum LB1]|eukprot:XP_012748307.1 hypothetical protein SAMD00019534_119280 [Acytostelium subglobosum LB1]
MNNNQALPQAQPVLQPVQQEAQPQLPAQQPQAQPAPQQVQQNILPPVVFENAQLLQLIQALVRPQENVVEREKRERERKEKAIRDAIPHCKWSEKTASIHSWTVNLRQMMVNTDCTEEELANHMGQLFDEPDRTWYYLLNPRPVTVQTLLEAMNTRFDIASKNIMLRTELEHLHQNGSPIANFNSRYGEKLHTLT